MRPCVVRDENASGFSTVRAESFRLRSPAFSTAASYRAAAATTNGATDLALLAAIAGPESVQAEDPPTSHAKRPKVTASFPSSPTSVLRKQEPPLWQDDDKPTLLQPDATIRRK